MIFKCPHCDTKAEAGRKECAACGRKMVRDCPYCAEEIAVKASTCKYCGEDVEPEKEPLRRAEEPRPAAPAARPDIEFIEESAKACAWEDTSKGVLRRWWGTWIASNLSPRRFMETLPPATGHKWPVGYAYGLLAQGIVVVGLALVLIGGLYVGTGHEISTKTAWGTAGVFAAAIPVSFLLVAAGLYVQSFVWHLLLWILGAKGGFQGTLRVVGYSSGTVVWNVIPWIGPLIGGLISLLLYYHGFRNVHGLSKGRAIFAVLLPVLLVLGTVAALVCCGEWQADCCAHEPF